MLLSVEHEMPAIAINNGKTAVIPKVFTDLWGDLSREGWIRDGEFSVSRMPSHPHPAASKPAQMLTTDTGPTIEISPSPARTIAEVEVQLTELRASMKQKLGMRNVGLLGSGMHPFLGTSESEYYRYRTPRAAYDYAIAQRGWKHRSILNIAAMQEILDVPVQKAPAIVSVMHRLAGAIIFLNRNDPDYRSIGSNAILSMRPMAWRSQIPTSGEFSRDIWKVGVPRGETATWWTYLRLLWQKSNMFLIGTKCSGMVYIPEHPTFAAFILSPPRDGWKARQLGTSKELRVHPSMDHVAQTDWSYMGFARLRIFWKEGTSLQELIAAYQGNEENLNAFMQANVAKVLLENRSSATPPPGEEMCSLALLTGIVENFDAAQDFVGRHPYGFWTSFTDAAEYMPLNAFVNGVRVIDLLSELLLLSEQGLIRRGFGEEKYLKPLMKRVHDECSPSERMKALYSTHGIDAVVEKLLY
jgi:gamma-glutamylcysteine synthetase